MYNPNDRTSLFAPEPKTPSWVLGVAKVIFMITIIVAIIVMAGM